MVKKRKIFMFIICILLIIVTGCNRNLEQSGDENETTREINEKELQLNFAVFEEDPVEISPQVEPYAIEADLSNITNRDMFNLSAEAEELLVDNCFVVVPSQNREFFMLYEINSYEPVPSFITTDSMLHNYHLFFSHLLRVTEKEKLAPELKKLTVSMLSESEKQYSALKNSDWENAAKRNLCFFAVAGKLLDENMPIPQQVKEEVEKELELIENHSGIFASPLMNMGQVQGIDETLNEDYSQYIPRGHYDSDDSLKSYFKAMMWYGRMTFRLKSEDETKSAVLITFALSKDDNEQVWDKIYQPTCFFVGKSDDLLYFQYKDLLNDIYGADMKLKELTLNKDKFETFMEAASKLKSPSINSIPIFDEDIQPDRDKEIKGFRFMGQRFTLDASVFQQLIYRCVGENSQGNRRMLPKALDIPTAMGSDEAYIILEDEGETNYANYTENMDKLRKYIGNIDKNTWTQNLYWSWLYTLNPLLEEKGVGYPSFMLNSAWNRKNLNTYLASWTELKHDTILYAKQVYAEMGGGMIGVDDRGYVEPNPHLYARLAALAKMTKEGLSSRKLIVNRELESLERLEQLALSLKVISEKELSNTLLTDDEYDLIRSYGGQLEHFWLEALRDTGVDHRSAIANNPAALVADVATNPNGEVLEEATGHIFEIYAVVPVDGSLRIARGGVYSHYEFPWSINDRLTDKKWHEMLDTEQTPPLAEWTKTFIAP